MKNTLRLLTANYSLYTMERTKTTSSKSVFLYFSHGNGTEDGGERESHCTYFSICIDRCSICIDCLFLIRGVFISFCVIAFTGKLACRLMFGGSEL